MWCCDGEGQEIAELARNPQWLEKWNWVKKHTRQVHSSASQSLLQALAGMTLEPLISMGVTQVILRTAELK